MKSRWESKFKSKSENILGTNVAVGLSLHFHFEEFYLHFHWPNSQLVDEISILSKCYRTKISKLRFHGQIFQRIWAKEISQPASRISHPAKKTCFILVSFLARVLIHWSDLSEFFCRFHVRQMRHLEIWTRVSFLLPAMRGEVNKFFQSWDILKSVI